MPAAARPPRRAAARRQRVESSEPDSDDQINEPEEKETPPPPTPRRQSKRRIALSTPGPSTTTPSVPRSTRTRRTVSVEPQATPSTTKVTAKRPRARRPRISETPSEQTVEEEEEREEDSVAVAGSVALTLVTTTAKRLRTRGPRISESPSEQNIEEATVTVGGSPIPTPTALLEPPAVHPQVVHLQAAPPPQLETPSPTPAPSEAKAPLEDITDSNNEIKSGPVQRSNHLPIVVKSRANALLQQQNDEPTESKPRLVITHLVLVNFKSYAGRQEVGPFHASFSSVVGPNGSGKSNVIDSLLFVFGFRASKMRQGKISALIHNSAAYPNLEYCEVEVHFQQVLDLPQGGHEIVPDSTLIVSRRAFKNNSSKYYIDGNTSDYTQVTTLLRGRGIDLDHKRFLILQGEVESIAQMKPKAQNEHDDGLLEYLEDIIGTSKYKQPIEESSSQVEEMNEVCVEKRNRVQHVEKEKNGLEGKKNLALEYTMNENDLATKKCALYQIHIADSDANIRVTSDMLMQLQTELDEELEKHRGSEEGIKKLEKKYKQGVKEIEDLEKQTQAILREVSRYDKENVKYLEKEKFLVQKQKKLQKAIHQNQLSASEAIALIEKHTTDIDKYARDITNLINKLEIEESELERIRDDLKEKTQGFSDQISVLQKSLEPWNEKINERRSAIAVTQSELDILHEKNNASKVALDEALAKVGTIEEARKTKEAEMKECRKERTKLQKEVQLVQSGYDKLVQKEPQLRSNLSGARQKADEAKSSLAATQTQGNVLTGLMRLKESGRIEGFHGRLGNLGTIDAKYDIAISTACPQLDNMVVDTVEAGQQCIDYLRKNNLGRANFICLDRLPARDLSPIDTPENAPRLFDLIKPKSEGLGSAFYSVVQNTLVAKDLVQANRIAYGAKRWRVVTLDGQLIDKSGTMTGGGTTVSKGRMSSKLVADTSKDAVLKLERERDAQELSYQEFQNQVRQLETDLRDLHDRLPELDITMSKIELEIESSVRHLADAERRVHELEAEQGPSSSADNSRVAMLEKKIKTLEKEISQLNAETAGIEDEIKVLQDRIMEVGGIKLRSQKSKVDNIREQLETLNQQVNAGEVAKAKAEKSKAKNEKVVADSEQEVEMVGLELENLREEMGERSKSAEESKERAEEAQAYLEQKKDELAEFKQNLDEKTTDLNKTRAAEIEMKNKLEEYQKMLAENQKRSKHWQSELAKLSLQNISDITGEDGSVEAQELPTYTEDELVDMDKNQLNAQIAVLEEKVQNVNVDLAVLQEYRRRVEEHATRSSDLENAISSRDAVKQRLDDFRKRRLEEFMEGFSIISLRLKEMYQMITMGGNAELELVDSLDPFSEGILFSVMPPKKSWKNISNLSGGEKTLSSLALVFALHHYKPTPLYVMDEIDAALDFRNVSIVASYIKERTKNAQFVVISLRNNMFELAARLVGVYKVNHMTKSVTIENKDYVIGR